MQDALSPARKAPQLNDYAWKALLIFSLYRLFLASMMLLLDLSGRGPAFLGGFMPGPYRDTAWMYMLLAGVFLLLHRWRFPRYNLQVILQVFCDILALTLFLHASGGIISGLGILMAVSVITGGLLLGGRTPMALAAFATLSLLIEQAVLEHAQPGGTTAYSQAGMLGAVFFITTFIATGIAERMRESELLASIRASELASLERLNEQVIRFMSTGVIAVDEASRIRLINQTAWQFLGMPAQVTGRSLDSINPNLAQLFRRWRRNSGSHSQTIRQGQTGPDLMPNFVETGGDDGLSLIFLQDTTSMTQQAQHLKLASLGRLTASIAHEIRNPLGAVSHAAQLLAESPDLDPADRRLTDIIRKHSERMNTIIENVLQLSHRKEPLMQVFVLKGFVDNLAEELRAHHPGNAEITAVILPPDTEVSFDPSQLMQVLINLCENGMRYSAEKTGRATLSLRGGFSVDLAAPFLDVIDNGEGIPPEIAASIFEPFFTTRAGGTGLGLYIARELCEANRARLDYLPIPSGGSCFRISFAANQVPGTTSA